jgi:ethanolamine permease
LHVWALGVGIVLVGEFMGWNYAVGKGGALGCLIAMWVIGLLYTCVAMIDSEITSTVAAAGGQYAQAKHTIGPLHGLQCRPLSGASPTRCWRPATSRWWAS